MSPRQQAVVVLRDADGNYYLLPKQTLARHRVPAERHAEIEEAIGGDVAGFSSEAAIINVVGHMQVDRPNTRPSARRIATGIGKATFEHIL